MRKQQEFTTTRWSVVLRAAGTSPDESMDALEQLCRDYWYPLYAFVRRKGYNVEDAADLTQQFFAKLLASNFVSGLEPEGGRFRSFLLTSLNRFLINEWEKGQRQKRGGGTHIISLDELAFENGEVSYLSELSHNETPEHLYQRTWAETLLRKALERMESECAGREDQRFVVLRPFLAAGGQTPSLTTAAESLGLSLSAFKSLLHRFRERYRELLLDEVSHTVGSKGEVGEEMRAIVSALRS